MVTKYELPSINPAYKKQGSHTGLDLIHVYDSFGELVKHCEDKPFREHWDDNFNGGGRTKAQALATCHIGDLIQAEKSNTYLEKLEHLTSFDSSIYKVSNQVSGGVVDVPSWLKNVPPHMRQRRRLETPLGPLTVVVDISSSGGISNDKMLKRGAAVLALVRLLSEKRPVTLYAGTGVGNGINYAFNGVYFPLDTAPIDLARAAYILDGTAVARGLCYGVCVFDMNGKEGRIPWAWGDNKLDRKLYHANLNRIFPGDLLAISSCHIHDDSLANPERWLTDNLAKYGFEQSIEAGE